MKKETKQQRFKRVAEKRVQNILNGIKSLSQCANQRVYAWDDAQLQRIWDALDHELAECKERFSDPDGSVFRL